MRISHQSPVLLALLLLGGCNAVDSSYNTLFDSATHDPNATISANDADNSERVICMETAKAVAAKGHYREAILLYEKAEGLAADESPLDLELAPLYAQSGDHSRAVARYRNAISNNRVDENVYNNLAWTLKENGQHQEAVDVIQQELAATPNDRRLRSTLAVVQFEQGLQTESLQTFEAISGRAAAHHNLAILELEQGDIEAAINHLGLASQIPGCPEESLILRDALLTKIAENPPHVTMK